MPTLLLVHGAWCAASTWNHLIPELERLNIPNRVLDLPGHGHSNRSMWSVSLADYANAVVDAAEAIAGQVIAVGHSMGGIVISEAAAKSPDTFQALTYLTAYLPRDGERLSLLSGKDPQSMLSSAIKVHVLKGATSLDPACLDIALFNDCSPETASEGKSALQANPIRPAFGRVHLNEQFETLPKHYISCINDHAISPAHQKWMAGRYKIKSMQDIDCGHMPMYSAPQQVASALAEVVSLETQ